MNWINRYKKKLGKEDYERGYRDYAERCKEALEEAGKEYHKHATKKFALDPESFYAGKIKALEELLE